MNFALFHDLAFGLLYACVAILIFVIIERAVYLTYLTMRSARVRGGLEQRSKAGIRPASQESGDPISVAVSRYLEMVHSRGATRAQLEDFSSALYLELDRKIGARLWILDTVITAAPLLGLLGTILGIMQTFTALSRGGISDPAEVSRGIGMALTATAIGIATALLGLVGHNILNRRAQLLSDDFKFFVLRAAPGGTENNSARGLSVDHEDKKAVGLHG